MAHLLYPGTITFGNLISFNSLCWHRFRTLVESSFTSRELGNLGRYSLASVRVQNPNSEYVIRGTMLLQSDIELDRS